MAAKGKKSEPANERRPFKAHVRLVGLKKEETAPAVAVYEIDLIGRPTRKLARVEGEQLDVQPEWAKLPGIALGPDVDDVKTLRAESVIKYRFDTIAPVWRQSGINVGRELWERFLFHTVCVSGRARKCHPWWWSRLEIVDASVGLELSRAIALKPLAEIPELHPILPPFCVPICDGIVEIYERVCCCRYIRIPDLLVRLREILEVIPIPLPDPPPFRIPIEPFPPGPGPYPAPFTNDLGQLAAERVLSPPTAASTGSPLGIHAQAFELRAKIAAPPEPASAPGERLYEDYVALAWMNSLQQAKEYVLARPYLIGLICTCTTRKVGEVPLQPDGRFDFCYTTPVALVLVGTFCHRTFAFKVRQRLQNTWVTVYDGVASHDWFAEGTSADLRTWDWRARVCGSGPGDPPPSDGTLPFVMLEYISSARTRHHNFPAQAGVSQMASLAANSGTYTTEYAPDCPWGRSLGLRLWVHPDMQPIAKYYRFSVVPVAASGLPSGAPTILDAAVTWQRWVSVDDEWVPTPEGLNANPADVGGQQGLIRIPYWSGGNYWLSSQNHQVWHTTLFSPDRYMLVLELFDATGARIKPNSAPPGDPGTAQPFQFLRWELGNPSATDNIPFADATHVFWIDNKVVEGDIVDFRKNGMESAEECQFINGPGTTMVAVGFRAFHARGVLNPTNTFMRSYSLTWHRGLNGPSGLFASGNADVGEPAAGPPHVSSSLTIDQLLGPRPGFPTTHQRCTFTVRLHVLAKHFNGSGPILDYDFHETASFALSNE